MKTCPVCNRVFAPSRKDQVYCCKQCTYKNYNDSRPRKTLKRYGLADKARKEHIPDMQKEIILGSLLGDGYLSLQTNNFHRLSLCHCEEQKEYIKLKMKLLSHIFFQPQPNRYKHNGSTQYHAHSISHKDLTSLYGFFYRNKKRFVTRRGLNMCSPTSLLFWFGDDGSIIKSSGNTIILCTDAYSLSENKAIKSWLWQEYDIEAKIMETKGSYMPHKIYYRLRLTKEPTQRFFHLMASSHFFNDVVKVLPQKFPEEYRSN